VSPFPQAAGAASALSGFLIMVVAFGMGGWIGRSLDGAPTGAAAHLLAVGLWFWAAVIAATAWTLVQRHGESRPPPVRTTPP
jgi:DHA1 family bicyclomycin/chloramphenicol resistance-like MFS transporter